MVRREDLDDHGEHLDAGLVKRYQLEITQPLRSFDHQQQNTTFNTHPSPVHTEDWQNSHKLTSLPRAVAAARRTVGDSARPDRFMNYSSSAQTPQQPDLTTVMKPNPSNPRSKTGDAFSGRTTEATGSDSVDHVTAMLPVGDDMANAVRLRYMRNLIYTLKRNEASEPFREPVDPVAHNAPSYFTTVKHPMDLSTMAQNVKRGAYNTVSAFKRDMQLTIDNCLMFNGREHPISQYAFKMQLLFDQYMIDLPAAGADTTNSINVFAGKDGKHTATSTTLQGSSGGDLSTNQRHYLSKMGHKRLVPPTPSATPDSTSSRLENRSPRYYIKKLLHLDGYKFEITPEFLQGLQQVAMAVKSSDPPFVKAMWRKLSNVETFSDNHYREWVTEPSGERLNVGRFKYGWYHQIVLAQGKPGSSWKHGKMDPITSFQSKNQWTAWNGTQEEAVPSVLCMRGNLKAVVQPDALQSGSRQPTEEPELSLATALQTAAVSVDGLSIPESQLPKRTRVSIDPTDSDQPIAAKKRRRMAPQINSDVRREVVVQSFPVSEPRPIVPPTTLPTETADGGPVENADSAAQPRAAIPEPEEARSPPSPPKSITEIKPKIEVEVVKIFELDDVVFHFVGSKGQIIRKRAFQYCSSTKLLVRAADGANIIKEEINKLTLRIGSRRNYGPKEVYELNIMRDDEQDFEEMKTEIMEKESAVVEVIRGTTEVV